VAAIGHWIGHSKHSKTDHRKTVSKNYPRGNRKYRRGNSPTEHPFFLEFWQKKPKTIDMQERRRQKRVSSLIKEELSRIFIQSFQDSTSGLITVTRVSMSTDLKTAFVDLSILGSTSKKETLDLINKRKSYLRKMIASKIKLKYNPMLIFSLDESFDYEKRIEDILKKDRIK
jgi:ribosome-binding factor A